MLQECSHSVLLHCMESAVTHFRLFNLHLGRLISLVGDRRWHFVFFLRLFAVMRCNVMTTNELKQ